MDDFFDFTRFRFTGFRFPELDFIDRVIFGAFKVLLLTPRDWKEQKIVLWSYQRLFCQWNRMTDNENKYDMKYLASGRSTFNICTSVVRFPSGSSPRSSGTGFDTLRIIFIPFLEFSKEFLSNRDFRQLPTNCISLNIPPIWWNIRSDKNDREF